MIKTESAEVLAGHERLYLNRVVGANCFADCRGHSLSQSRIVVERRRIFSFNDFHDRRPIFGNSGRQRHPLSYAFDRGENALANFFTESANGQLQGHFIRNDIALGASMNRADSYYRGIEWRVLA